MGSIEESRDGHFSRQRDDAAAAADLISTLPFRAKSRKAHHPHDRRFGLAAIPDGKQRTGGILLWP